MAKAMFLLIAYCLLLSIPAYAASTTSLWYADSKTVKQIDTTTNQIIQTIYLSEEAKKIAADSQNNAVWIITPKQFIKADFSGSFTIQKNLKDISKNLEEPAFLILNPYDGSLWIGAKKTIFHLDSSAKTIFTTQLDHTAKSASISLDETLWLVTEEELIRISKDGRIILTQTLEGIIDEPKHIAVDSINNLVYIAGEDEIIQLDINNLTSSKGVLSLYPPQGRGQGEDSELKAMTLNQQSGDLWFITENTLYHYHNYTAAIDAINISQNHKWEDIKALLIEPMTQSLWLATEKAVIRLSDTGTVAATIAADKQIRAIAAAPFQVMPTISVKQPPKDGLTNNPMPDIKFTLGSNCNTAPCALQNSYTDKFTLDITLNAAPIGDKFAIKDNEAFYSPATRLPEGANTITAKATDQFSHTTDTITSSFTIDTIPPRFISITPADGSILTNPDVTISGSVDDPQGVIILDNMLQLGASMISSGPKNFSYQVQLKQGINSFTFTAYDMAGNSSHMTLTITYAKPNPLPPDPAIVATPIDSTVATTAYSATAFLYTGNNPIQTGVAAGTIEPKRIAVLRGKVSDDSGSPLSGVQITILNHTEFGSTLTRTDGMFDMAVNGGGWLTVNYQKDGYLPVQRQVNAPWQDYAWLPDVVMIPYDTKVTSIDLNSTTPIQVARGNPSTDADGTRTATLLFQQGSSATMTLANGTSQAITTLNVRATEYTVGTNGPKRMPAALPPTSGYTYAVELSVDEATAQGAKSVTFSKPVITYIENFLNFPVGTPVPVGYYDRDKGVWIPSNNGIIIKILSITNGMADIDINGTSTPAAQTALASLGITDAERQQLATLYQAGQSLWRVPITHFTPWDCNWPYGPPQDATAPKQPEPTSGSSSPPDGPTNQCGSIIGCETQTLGETIDISGTPFSLNYQSDRTPGYIASRTLKIPLSGAAIPSSLKRIELEINVAGRKFTQTFSAAPNQSYTFTWDGKDAYGRTIQGKQEVSVRVGYVYQAVYYQPAQFAQSFASASGGGSGGSIGIIGNRANLEIAIWQEYKSSIGIWDARNQGLGAWTLNIHHAYATTGQTLYLGDGRTRKAQDIGKIITTVAGNGSRGYSGDGGPATSASLYLPFGVAVDNQGNLYIADYGNNRIRKVSPDGIITTVAGNGFGGYSGDGGPATSANLWVPTGVAVDNQGNLYIADFYNHRVRKVSPDGIITTVAGNGFEGYSGDGGPATSASLSYPYGVAVDSQGNLYIADFYNHRVRKVTPDGIITTVAGNPPCYGWQCGGYSGDGGPATSANLYWPTGVAVDNQGNLYIADFYNHRVRKVSPDGIITTVAGNGSWWSYGGDGGPATSASLYYPFGLAVDSQGSLYIADTYNNRVRKVTPDGIITTVAGNGSWGYSGDGGPATSARLSYPSGVTVDSQGNLYIADFYNNRIRKVYSVMPQFNGQDIAIPSEDGKELYQFNSVGKHLKTIDAITGKTKYAFTYGSTGSPQAGYLTSITDRDGNITTIERDGSNNATAIIASGGQRTTLTMDANGYLATIANPNNETHRMTYTSDGLMTSFTKPRGSTSTSTFAYDSLGRLTKDMNAIGGYKALTRTDNSTTKYTVLVSTALGRIDTYTVETLSTGDTKRTSTDPNNLITTTNIGTNGTTTTTSPDGTVTTKTEGPDPRWGMQSPVTTALTIKTPSGLTYSLSGSRTATLSDSTNLLSLTNATDTVTVNSKTYTSAYTASTKTITSTSPVGRKSYTTLDSLGRISSEQLDSLNATNYSYDTKGRLTSITQGTGIDVRNYSIAYDAKNEIASITDAVGRNVGFVYDGAGRVTQKTLPDGRVINYSYDANGNITSITPPSRPAHAFTYTGVDLEESYVPPSPQPPVSSPTTFYSYNLDKQLTLITRPDSQTISLNYDTGGRLSSSVTPPLGGGAGGGGTISYSYSTTIGNLSAITAPNSTLSFTYDGSLLKGTTWSGSVAGSVSFNYNSDFRVSSESVNGANTVSFTYDNDGLLTGVGSLTISRNTQNGLITGTSLGSTATTQSYNGFGEMSQMTANYGGGNSFNVQYTRDKLGRITDKPESINGVSYTYSYGYDTAGRLTTVARNGATISQYNYDGNSNRISKTTSTGTITATYDNQDRLLTYGNNSYSYTANGELQSKTSASGTTNYHYDVLGNLLSVTLPDNTVIEYVVDGQNRRIGKKVNGSLVQGFLYESQLRPVAELDGSGAIVSRFVYATKINVPDYMIRSGVTYRIITDHLGSPRFVIDTSTGIVAQEMDYDEFGNVIFDTNPGFQPFGFAGGIYDNHTKLTRFGVRDYDAETGRWTAKDPIRFRGKDTNLYGYTMGDPVNWVDPWGLVAPWLVPQFIINNTQMVVNVLTNNAFSQGELNKLTDLVIEKIGYLDALKFAPVGFDPHGNVPLTKEQKKIIDDLFKDLLKDKDNQDLIKKALEEYNKAFEGGRCYLK